MKSLSFIYGKKKHTDFFSNPVELNWTGKVTKYEEGWRRGLSSCACTAVGKNLGKASKGASPAPVPAQNNNPVPSVEPARGTQSQKETLQIQRKLGRLCSDPLLCALYPCLLAWYTHFNCWIGSCGLWRWLCKPNCVPIHGNGIIMMLRACDFGVTPRKRGNPDKHFSLCL